MYITMLSSFLQYGLILSTGFLLINCLGDKNIGPGMWRVLSVGECEVECPMDLNVIRRKVNRTHDGFSVRTAYDKPIDDKYGILINVCKEVDGGCKLYQVLSDDSLEHFVKQYAEDNMRSFLQLAGIEPPDFPVPAGEHKVDNYVFDYTELPSDAAYGVFGAEVFALLDDEKVACIYLKVEFYEVDDEEGER